MNHKILEQIKGGTFLAGDLPMSTSSKIYKGTKLKIKIKIHRIIK